MTGLISFGYIEYGTGYYELMPQIDCFTSSQFTPSCSQEQVCQGTNSPQVPYQINYANSTSLHNWVEQLDLICVPPFTIGGLGSCYFAGWSTLILIVPPLADKVGRKWVFWASCLVAVATMLVLLNSRDLKLTMAMMFVAGMCNAGRVQIGFLFASEFLVERWQVVFTTAFMFIDSSTIIWLTIYFDWVSKQYEYIASVGAIFGTICCGLTPFFVPESPLWQLKMRKIYEASDSLRQMSKINGV